MITMLAFPQFDPKNELLMKTPLSKIAWHSGYIPSTYDFFYVFKVCLTFQWLPYKENLQSTKLSVAYICSLQELNRKLP